MDHFPCNKLCSCKTNDSDCSLLHSLRSQDDNLIQSILSNLAVLIDNNEEHMMEYVVHMISF